jgi:hypothetical protein
MAFRGAFVLMHSIVAGFVVAFMSNVYSLNAFEQNVMIPAKN